MNATLKTVLITAAGAVAGVMLVRAIDKAWERVQSARIPATT